MSNIMESWPPSRSASAGALPLYGTWVSCVPVASANSSPERWLPPPTPVEPYEIAPGFALAAATMSAMLFHGELARVTSTYWYTAHSEIGAKSLIGS